MNGPFEDFAKLYQSHRRRVLSQCYGMLRNYSDAEDAAQEVFLRVFLKAHTFRGESSFSTWLYRLTTNCVLMQMRKRRCRSPEPTSGAVGVGAEVRMTSGDPSADLVRKLPDPIIERVTIGAALSRLPSGYQTVFELHDIRGHTHREISNLLGIRPGTSKSQLSKARLRLRLILQEQGDKTLNPIVLPRSRPRRRVTSSAK